MIAQLDRTAFASLVELLRQRAEERTGRGYTFLAEGEREEAFLSFEKLDWRARSLGAVLQRHGLGGQRVLLVYPAGLEYIVGFFGCLYAGAVAVPRTRRTPAGDPTGYWPWPETLAPGRCSPPRASSRAL